MIQDIAPAKLSLHYDLRTVDAGDIVCLFSGRRILTVSAPAGTLRLPRFCELPGITEADCWFLFSIAGVNYFWCRRPLNCAGGDYSWLSLRRAMTLSPQETAFAALTARHLADWYASNRYCGRCGRAMVRHGFERALVCSDCGYLSYPRINPAIIVGVTDGDRLLVTKYAAAHGPTRFFALIAGFCEIGETAEDTVRREVLEEVGLHIKNIRYYGSQPWGIDGNLSIGYFADLDGSDQIRLQEEELSQAVWVSREEVPQRGNTLALTAEMMEAFRAGKIGSY